MSELNFDLALTQQFLGDLARNNSLDWMHAHQTEYKLARKQFEDLARAVNEQLAMNNPRAAGHRHCPPDQPPEPGHPVFQR